VALSDTLNKGQQAAYDEIMSSIDTEDGGLFFVDGPGGTGKTYLCRALLATIRSQKKIVVSTATSGVAAATSYRPGPTHHRHTKKSSVAGSQNPRVCYSFSVVTVLVNL